MDSVEEPEVTSAYRQWRAAWTLRICEFLTSLPVAVAYLPIGRDALGFCFVKLQYVQVIQIDARRPHERL